MSTWPLVDLEEVSDISAGNPAPQDANHFCVDGHLFVRMQDVGRKHIDPALVETTDRVSSVAVRECRLRLYPAGTLLIPKSGASVNLNHRAMLGQDAYVVSHLATIIPDQRKVLPTYLFHWSQRYDPRSQAQVTSLPSLPLSLIKAAKVPLPPLEEQRRIVGLLDRAAEIRRRADAARAKARAIIPALFLDTFGDPATNPKGWKSVALDGLCDLVRGSSPRPQGDPRFFSGPVPRLMISDITRDGTYVTPSTDSLTIEGANRSRPMKAGDVVMAVSGAVGLPAILAIDACIHDGFVGFRNLGREVGAQYFYYYLLAVRKTSQSQAVGATFQNLNTDQIRRWIVPIPPEQHQKVFTETANRLEALARHLDAAAAKAEAMAAALSAEVFVASPNKGNGDAGAQAGQ